MLAGAVLYGVALGQALFLIPLIVVSVLCLWAMRLDRGFEVEIKAAWFSLRMKTYQGCRGTQTLEEQVARLDADDRSLLKPQHDSAPAKED